MKVKNIFKMTKSRPSFTRAFNHQIPLKILHTVSVPLWPSDGTPMTPKVRLLIQIKSKDGRKLDSSCHLGCVLHRSLVSFLSMIGVTLGSKAFNALERFDTWPVPLTLTVC